MKYILNQKSLLYLDKLKNLDWFCNIGKKRDGNFVFVKTWEDVIKNFYTYKFNNVIIESRNIISRQLPDNEYEKWNIILETSRDLFDKSFNEKIEFYKNNNIVPFNFINHEDFGYFKVLLYTHIMELEYEPFLDSPGFFTLASEVFLQGHFPCGWKGRFPDGKLIIF